MNGVDYFVGLVSAAVMIIGGYQFYFFVQRRHLGEARLLPTAIDDYIPFWPSWVWIYSGLYYPIIVALVFLQPDFRAYNYTAFSFLILLAMQFLVFLLLPTRVPDHWREFDPKQSMAHRFLGFVQSYDQLSNSLPSMHVSVATLTAIHLYLGVEPLVGPSWASLSYAFPLLISLSAVFTKQHYVIDLPPGVAFGWLAWRISEWFLAAPGAA